MADSWTVFTKDTREETSRAMFSSRVTFWKCFECDAMNRSERKRCHRCGSRPGWMKGHPAEEATTVMVGGNNIVEKVEFLELGESHVAVPRPPPWLVRWKCGCGKFHEGDICGKCLELSPAWRKWVEVYGEEVGRVEEVVDGWQGSGWCDG